MAEKVASLYASIDADTKGLEKGLASTKAGLKQTGKEMTTFGGNLKNAIVNFGGMAIAAGAAYKAVGAVGDFFKSSVYDTIDYAKAVRDVARYTGTSAEESSKFLQIADDLQIETNTLKVGFRSLNNEGIQPNIENIKNLAVQYQALKSPVDKAQFAMKMFGARSGMEMAKMLELTADQIDNIAQSAEDLGLVLDSKAIQATEDFRLSVDQLNDAWKGLKTTVGMAVVPALTEVTTGAGNFTTAFKLASKATDAGTYSMVDFFTTWMQLSSQAEMDQYINDLRDAADGLTDGLGDARQESILAMQAIGEFADSSGTFQKKLSPLSAAIWDLSKGFDPIGTMAGIASDAINNFADTLAEKQAIFLAFQKMMGTITEEQFNQGMAALDQIQLLERLAEGTETGTVTQEEFFRVIADGKVDVDEINEAFGLTTDLLDDNIERYGVAGQKASTYADDITGKIPPATSDLAANAGEVGAIASSWAGVPRDVTTTYHLKFDIQYGGGGMGFNAPGDFWGESGDTGSSGGGGGGGKVRRQAGGPVWQGAPYIVGEAGPELFVPSTSGRIVSNKQVGEMGGDTIIINNNSAGAAALTMALIAQQHRARLSRSMGG